MTLTIGLATLAALGLLAYRVLAVGPVAYWDELVGQVEMADGEARFRPGKVTLDAKWFRDNAARYHRGEAPCLRYVSPEQATVQGARRLARAVEAAGLSDKLVEQHYFNSLFFKWRLEREERAHRLDEHEEMLDAVAQRVGWLDRLTIRLNRQKLLGAARQRDGQMVRDLLARAKREEAALSAAELEALRALWSRFGVETCPPGLMKLRHIMGRQVSAGRMERIEAALRAWVAARGAPPDELTELTAAKLIDPGILRDGWHSEFLYRRAGDQFRLLSYGADRKPGGHGQAADLIRKLTLP